MDVEASISGNRINGIIILPADYQQLRYVRVQLEEDLVERAHKRQRTESIFSCQELLQIFPYQEKRLQKFYMEIPKDAVSTISTTLFETKMQLVVYAEFRNNTLKNTLQLYYFTQANRYGTFVPYKQKKLSGELDIAISCRRTGDIVPFEASIVNMSKWKLTHTEIQLVRRISNSWCTETKTLLRYPMEAVGAGKSCYLEGIVDILRNCLQDEYSFYFNQCSVKYFVQLAGKHGIVQQKRCQCVVEVVM